MKLSSVHFRAQTAATQQAWLDQLGKRLVPHYSLPQTREILEDYREQFQAGIERGRSEEEVIKSLGSPQEAAARLLEESPSHSIWGHTLLWGAMLALCLLFLRSFVFWSITAPMSHVCGFLGIPMTAGTLFALLRGQARAELERRFPPERTASPALLSGPPLALAVIFEASLHLLVANAAWVADAVSPLPAGIVVQLLCFGLAGIGAALALWWIFRSVTRSIACFPGVIHALGLALSGLTSLLPFISMEVVEDSLLSLTVEALLAMLPYLSGLITALLFRKWIAAQFPACFRPRGGGQREWLDSLGKRLLRWFPAVQVKEILSDYQEQFELGAERGKSEVAMVEELGRPETVARDLLAAESPLLRRVARQRTLLWLIPLVPAVYYLVGLLYNYGVGIRWLGLSALEPPLFLTLGAVSTFALLHGRGRAEIEALFPPERGKPSPAIFLLPVAAEVLAVAAFCYILIHSMEWGDMILPNWSLGPLIISYIELSTLLMGALLVWALAQSARQSIRYFPAAILACGSLATVLNTGYILHTFDPLSANFSSFLDTVEILLRAGTPGLTSLVLAIGFGTAIAVLGAKAKEG